MRKIDPKVMAEAVDMRLWVKLPRRECEARKAPKYPSDWCCGPIAQLFFEIIAGIAPRQTMNSATDLANSPCSTAPN
jgi:hypothetical protein